MNNLLAEVIKNKAQEKALELPVSVSHTQAIS
jgi:hypothetical protein